MILNADAGDILKRERANFIQILWDVETLKMALRPLTRPAESSYKLSTKSGRRGMTISGAAFLRHIGWKFSESPTVLPVAWNEKEKLLEVLFPAANIDIGGW